MGELKVVDLPTSPPDQVKEQTKVLEEVLAEAKEGKLETLFVVALTRDERVLQRWTPCDNLVVFLGHLARAQHIAQRRLDGDFDDS